MSIKDYSAYFIPEQCMFGAYPTQNQIQELEELGIDIIVDLTEVGERNITPYQTKMEVIRFPIPDNKIPQNYLVFYDFMISIVKKINENKKIYIHCKAGHGRSGILVSSILCYLHNLTPLESFKKTNYYHSTRLIHARRLIMNEYWKKRGSPQTPEQKQFVINMFKNLL